jgi:hypothetical protein
VSSDFANEAGPWLSESSLCIRVPHIPF